MTLLNQLLTATDLSSSSLHAVDRGFQIAGRTGAKYSVLHALGLDVLEALRGLLGGDVSVVSRSVTAEVRDALIRILADPSRNLGVQVALELQPGMAASIIPGYAAAIGADLILVGAHGKGFLQRYLLGSTASRLLRTSRQPVLVVKEPCRTHYRRVMVAVDFSPASVKAVTLAKKLAVGAERILLHVFDVPFEGKSSLRGLAST